ncbi:hypothetical protein TPHA_0H00910 [Tetrapisispora phaffii CBS 4417]|uniref:Histone chaperone RTT106 n=1 Tax=Tetrapisispora phaffii (strain ATCC 24235 / CBS 4417 / NBRC 1672 / NRRL Y-8282 / UCD 70-5) TaxID=1071381 RepID=G8BWZ5_TETPH|nr:hypothetical protein TPHA_0H00910 [Tetrapisispora phaffii CBS 4417]CCE64299.1 hypothetical protein TPHA_0H00910 [Tetrapisispora phaffii CBS 4417]
MSQDLLDKLPATLRGKVEQITRALPNSKEIFDELYTFALAEANEISKRKVQKPASVPVETAGVDVKEEEIIFNLKDVTVLSPLRKKLNLILHLSTSSRKPVLSLAKDTKIEMTIEDLKTNVKMATFLPVPEKSNIFYIFINYQKAADDVYTEPILATINKAAILDQFKTSGLVEIGEEDFTKCIEFMRKQAIMTGFRISDPFFKVNPDQDVSFHVECHRGTKEGTLYFLPDHIIFGFKKPILLFESADIESITYSSITRLTFNVTLITKDDRKFEFSMIDQAEYSKIDEYVKRKQVKDRSMSEELKAKTSHKNQASQENQVSSLQEAAQQLAEGENLKDMNLDSDDEEGDVNFEAESELSDGSDDGEDDYGDDDEDEEEGADEGADEGEYNEKTFEEAEKAYQEENDDEGDSEDNDEREDDENDEYMHDFEKREEHGEELESNISPQEGFPVDLGLDDIPIEIDDDEDGDNNNEEDDGENSGVEYD